VASRSYFQNILPKVPPELTEVVEHEPVAAVPDGTPPHPSD
jgi:hypothetical protein